MNVKKTFQDTHKVMSPEEMKKVFGGELEGRACGDSGPTCNGACSPIFTGQGTISRSCKKAQARSSGFEFCTCI